MYNLSNLDITLYSTDNGAVGMWAFDIYTSKDQQSKIIDINGYKVYYGDGHGDSVLAYEGTSAHIAFPYTNVMPYAFYLNQNIQSAIIYDYWGTCLDEGTFMGCSNLQTVTISNSVIQIKAFVFLGCLNLETIMYDGTIEEWERIDKEDYWNEGLMETAIVRCTDGEVSIFKN